MQNDAYETMRTKRTPWNGVNLVKMLSVFWMTVLRNVRDRGSFTEMLLMPMLLIFILGNALGGFFTPTEIGQVRAALVGHEAGTDSDVVLEFFQIEEIASLVEIQSVDTWEDGRQLMASGWAHAIVDVSQFRGVNGQEGTVPILVEGLSAGSFSGQVLTTILDSFVNGANTVEARIQMGDFRMQHEYLGPFLQEESVSGAAATSAVDYYAVTMLVMTILYGALYASAGMSEDFLEPVGRRIRSTAIGPWSLFTGKVLGVVFTLTWQIALLILFTAFVYDVNWGSQPWAIAGICLSAAMFSTALGVMAVTVVRDGRIAANILNSLIPLFTLVAGGYIRIDYPGAVFAFLQRLSPSFLVQTALFNSIYGGGTQQTMMYVAVLWSLTLVMFAAGAFFVQRGSDV